MHLLLLYQTEQLELFLGSCQVTVSTLDGSGISASITVTVTKKPEPPKPQEPQTPNNSGGDGKPNIGDAVIYKLEDTIIVLPELLQQEIRCLDKPCTLDILTMLHGLKTICYISR